jgi:ankyrin repeat protein
MSNTSDPATFIRAVRGGDLDGVRAMAGADPSLVRATDPQCFGATALIHAVGAEDRALVELLLELGADIDQRSDWWAGSFGVLDSASDEMAAYLLQRGATLTAHAAARLAKIDGLRAMLDADASIGHARGGDGQTPLHFARSVEIADLLLAHGAEIDALDIDHGSTPAQWLGGSRPEVAAHLVLRGAAADPFLAARIGDVALLEGLIRSEPEGVRVRVSRDRFPVPPPAAGHIYLFTIGEGCTLLHAAAGADTPQIVRWLAGHGADVNARGGYDDGTPLHVGAWGDHAAAVGALIDAGADINAKSGNQHHNEPIGWAIVSGAVRAFRVLLERGATVQPWHREDARKGAQGAFREFNPRRPIEAWREIVGLLDAGPLPRPC